MVEILGAVVVMFGAVKLWAAGINWALVGILALAAAAVIGSYSWVIYNKGYTAGQLDSTAGAVASNEKADKDHAKIETETYSLRDDDLYGEYSRWLH